jgi:hypothetical protein
VSDPFGNALRRDGDYDSEPATERLPGAAQAAASSPAAPAATPAPAAGPSRPSPAGPPLGGVAHEEPGVDLARRRDELRARFAELQWDLGGLTYEMAIRDHIRLDVLVRHAAVLQEVDAELGEVERILHLEETGTAGSCASCGAPHSAGAVYCWQCGQPLMRHVPSQAIGA